MLEYNLELRDNIVAKINQLSIDSRNQKALILSEVDLQCLLYKRLSEIDLLNEVSETNDGYLTTKIHTEISFYDHENLLRIRPDITLMLPENLSITNGFDRPLPSKGYHSIDGGIIFELKFDKGKTRISLDTVEYMRRDAIKFQNLLQRYDGEEHSLFCFFILFVKSREGGAYNEQRESQIAEVFEALPNDKYNLTINYIGV